MMNEIVKWFLDNIDNIFDIFLVILGFGLNEITHIVRSWWGERKITNIIIQEINKEISEFKNATKTLKESINKNKHYKELLKDLHINHAMFQPVLLKDISNMIHILRISDEKRESLLKLGQYSLIINYFIESSINILSSPNGNNAAEFSNMIMVDKNSFIKNRIDNTLSCIEEYEALRK